MVQILVCKDREGYSGFLDFLPIPSNTEKEDVATFAWIMHPTAWAIFYKKESLANPMTGQPARKLRPVAQVYGFGSPDEYWVPPENKNLRFKTEEACNQWRSQNGY